MVRVLSSALIGLASPLLATAQVVAPSQVLPRTIAPPLPTPPAIQDLRSTQAPPEPSVPGAELRFDAGTAIVDGGFAEMAEANQRFVATNSGRSLSVSELFEAAHQLEQAYAREGYILARVAVPPQKLSSGSPVHVLVIDGFIEDIDVSRLAESARSAVLGRTQVLVGGHHMTEDKIERRLLLASQLAGLKLRSALSPGREVGGVSLVLEGELQRFSTQLSMDNRLPASLGRGQWSGTQAFNGGLGLGEQLYINLASGLDSLMNGESAANFRTLGAGFDLPLGDDGWALAAELLDSRTRPRNVPGVPGSLGEFSRTQFRARYPLLLTRRETLNVNLTLDFIRQSLSLPAFDAEISRDAYTAARLGLDWHRWVGAVELTADGNVSQGLAGRAGTAQLPSSRLEASPNFRRVQGNLRASVPLDGGFAADLSLRGQLSFGAALFLSEQFALDASNAVSAFPTGSFSVDNGLTARGELRLPTLFPVPSLLAAPYVYAAAGQGRLTHPTAAEQARQTAGALGFGVRTGLQSLPLIGGRGASFGFEFGHQFSNVRSRSSGSRASVNASFEL